MSNEARSFRMDFGIEIPAAVKPSTSRQAGHSCKRGLHSLSFTTVMSKLNNRKGGDVPLRRCLRRSGTWLICGHNFSRRLISSTNISTSSDYLWCRVCHCISLGTHKVDNHTMGRKLGILGQAVSSFSSATPSTLRAYYEGSSEAAAIETRNLNLHCILGDEAMVI
jgi:hypothetical protein